MIFLDNNSTTPIAPEVLIEMEPWLNQKFANPSSTGYRSALETDARIELTRKKISDILGCFPDEIFFTSGSTESINTVLRGFAFQNPGITSNFISSKLEHSTTLETLKFLNSKCNSRTHWLENDEFGNIQFKVAISLPQNSLLSLMWVNNEIGNINDIASMLAFAKENRCYLHLDGAQGVGKLPFNLSELQIDALSFSGHKIYGPKGTGVLFLRKAFQKLIAPLLTGGGQNFGFRSGTINVPGIVGLGKALELMESNREIDMKHIGSLVQRMVNGISILSDSFYINGNQNTRIYSTLNFGFRDIESSFWFKHLKDVAFSTGAACTSGKTSHVLKEIGLSNEIAKSSIRMGFGRFNTIEEVDYIVKNFQKTLNSSK